MNLTMHFSGYIEEIIRRAQARGIAKTKAEAIRLSLLKLNEEYRLVDVDWHPADEKEFRKEFVRSVEKARKGKMVKGKSVDELFE